jgi:hypothetical protein
MSTNEFELHRAIVHSSNTTTGEAQVRIPTLLGAGQVVNIPTTGLTVTAGEWNVPSAGSSAFVAVSVDRTQFLWVTGVTVPTDSATDFTGNVTIGGDLGIGTSSPSTILAINKSGDPVLRVTGTDGNDTASLQLLESDANTPTYGLEIKYDGDANITKIGHYNSNTTVRTDMEITRAGGYVTMPNQPRFEATRSATFTSAQYVPFDVIEHDSTGSFSTSTYRYTVPVSGTYFFYWTNIGQTNSGTVHRYYFHVNGSDLYVQAQLRLDQTGEGTGKYTQASQQRIVPLNANDYVQIYYAADNGGGSYGNVAYTRFGGYLLG